MRHPVGYPRKNFLDHASPSNRSCAGICEETSCRRSGSQGPDFPVRTRLQSTTRRKRRRVKKHLIRLFAIVPVQARKPVPSASRRFTSKPLPLRHPRMAEGALTIRARCMTIETPRPVTRHLSSRLFGSAAYLGFLLVCAPAEADPATDPTITGSIEQHWTTNALDSDRAVADWYTLLRGSIDRQWGDADANARVHADFEASRYNRVSIEDDRSLALSAQAFRRLETGLELRGTLDYRVQSTGDDLEIGPFIIGTRELKQILSVQGQIGIDLGNATSLTIEATETIEKVGDTHFQDDLISPTKLHADRILSQMAARLTRTVGEYAFGGSTSALLASVERVGFPPLQLSFFQYTAQAEAAFKGKDGSSFGLALGVQYLRGADGIYQRVLPAWQANFVQPLPKGFELRGTCFARYETSDTDDPLASWLRRAELELGLKLRENVAVGTGIFAQLKDNLLLENVERSKGVYAEATWGATKSLNIVFRVDYSQKVKTILDEHENTVDAFVGVRTNI
ncbi:hypothetical protein [Mesorhizobium sp. B4-1-1]|uniref:hypothetical protein n=1 Tax=Mesorhizobium sp. B4-1-1 TaxID=2589890 RepID=UPI001FEE3592|nr:hypothetical protein [Mesorhizobium sp. B4-1-1]